MFPWLQTRYFLIADNGSDFFAGGTSAAAPLWAGLTALINQQRATHGQPSEGFLNPALYAIGNGANYSSCFHDITVGNNTNLSSSKQFFATTGMTYAPAGAHRLVRVDQCPRAGTATIAPPAGLAASGSYGGPFNVANQNFPLTNAGSASVSWSVGFSLPWLSPSSLGSALVPGGASASISVTPNSLVNTLTVGTHVNTIFFTNINDGVVQNFQFFYLSQATPLVTWLSPPQSVMARR